MVNVILMLCTSEIWFKVHTKISERASKVRRPFSVLFVSKHTWGSKRFVLQTVHGVDEILSHSQRILCLQPCCITLLNSHSASQTFIQVSTLQILYCPEIRCGFSFFTRTSQFFFIKTGVLWKKLCTRLQNVCRNTNTITNSHEF